MYESLNFLVVIILLHQILSLLIQILKPCPQNNAELKYFNTLWLVQMKNNSLLGWPNMPITLSIQPHVISIHLERMLPMFDPNKSRPLEDYIKQFMLVVRLMNVQHEDVFFHMCLKIRPLLGT